MEGGLQNAPPSPGGGRLRKGTVRVTPSLAVGEKMREWESPSPLPMGKRVPRTGESPSPAKGSQREMRGEGVPPSPQRTALRTERKDRPQRKAPGGALATATVCAALVLTSFGASATAAVVNVGGDAGWIVQDYSPLNVSVGDRLNFTYAPTPGTFHNVWLLDNAESFLTCDFSSATLLANDSTSYFFNVASPGTLFFACNAHGIHCASGQKVQVTAGGALAPYPAPGPTTYVPILDPGAMGHAPAPHVKAQAGVPQGRPSVCLTSLVLGSISLVWLWLLP